MLLNSFLTHYDDSNETYYSFGIWRQLQKEDRKVCLGEREKKSEFTHLEKNT